MHRLLERARQVHVWNAHEGLDLSLDALEVSETLSYRRGLAASMALCAKCHSILGDYTRALAEAETALKLFDSDNDTESFADCQCTLADVYSLMGDFFHALHLLEETSRTSPSISPKTKARILFTQGGVYQALADYAKALAHHNESLLVCTDAGDAAGRATALSSIGSVYSDLGEYATAISFYRQSLSIYQEVEDKGGEAWTLERMGTLCTRMGGLEDALAFHHRSLVLRRDANNHRGVAGCLFYIGEILSKQGLEEQAIVMFNESLRFWESAHDFVGMAETYLAFAALYQNEESEQFNTLKATELLVKCLRIAQDSGLKLLEMRIHEAFTVSYKQIRLFEKALLHKEKAVALRGVIAGEDVSKQVQQLEITLKQERLEREMERGKKESAELIEALRRIEELETQARNVSREKEEFFSIVNHDLKNPIAGILVQTSTLERYMERMSHSEIRGSISAIAKTAHRMKEIVTNLKKGDAHVERSEAMETSHLDMADAVREVVADLHARAFAKSQSIRFDDPIGASAVIGDRAAIQRCAENLLSNAIKYSPNNTAITVSITPSPRECFVRLTVTDQGLGIEPERLAKLFSGPLKDVGKTTGGEDSSGIGLVSVKRLVERMRGSVDCTSEPGVGSSFSFDLPTVPER